MFKNTLIRIIVEALLKEITKESIDDFLDVLEKAAQDSATKIDDATVLPLINTLRAVIGIPDDVGGDPD